MRMARHTAEYYKLKEPLHCAAKDGTVTQLEELLKAGADVNKLSANKLTALHVACQWNTPETVELLLSYKSDINAKNDNGCTPLHEAIEGSFENVQILLKAGADMTVRREDDDFSCLELAVSDASPRVVKLLIEYGADIGSLEDETGGLLGTALTYNRLESFKVLLAKYFEDQQHKNMHSCLFDCCLMSAFHHKKDAIASYILSNVVESPVWNDSWLKCCFDHNFCSTDALLKPVSDALSRDRINTAVAIPLRYPKQMADLSGVKEVYR